MKALNTIHSSLNRLISNKAIATAPATATATILLIMLTSLSFLARKATENNPVEIPKRFDWQGHRGCRGLLPENSIPAFLKATEFPEVSTLELDLAVSKDNQLIVSHEPWFNPAITILPNGDTIPAKDSIRYLIYQLTAEEIKGFDCGSRGNPRFPLQQKMRTYKPTLRETVEAVRKLRPDMRWNIEIKSQPDWDGLRHPPIETFVQMVVAEVRALGLEKLVNIQSFDVRALNALHRQAPDLQTAFLIENPFSLESNMARLEFVPTSYSPYYLMVNKKLVRKCHSRNMKLVPWTVNDVKSMRLLIRLGVDGIITDYPDKISEVGK